MKQPRNESAAPDPEAPDAKRPRLKQPKRRVLGTFRSWLRECTRWCRRLNKEEEGYVKRMYYNSSDDPLTCGSDQVVTVVCRTCEQKSTKSVKAICKYGCKFCRENLRAELADAVAHNTGKNPTGRGDVIERHDAELLRAAGYPAEVIGMLQASYDLIVLLVSDGTIRGVQIKLARRNDKKKSPNGTSYKFKINADKYRNDMIIKATIPIDNDGELRNEYLVASMKQLRDLSACNNSVAFSMAHDSPHRQRGYIHKTEEAATAAVIGLLHDATVLTRDILINSLAPTHRQEWTGYQAIHQLLAQHGERFCLHDTHASSTDAWVRGAQCQNKVTASFEHGRTDQWLVKCQKYAGIGASGRRVRMAYGSGDFHWLIVVVLNSSGVVQHIFWIPMSQLIKQGVVTDGTGKTRGKTGFAVAALGHGAKAKRGGNAAYDFPYFQNCCDNPAPFLAELRSGKWGARVTVSSTPLFDRLMQLPEPVDVTNVQCT